MYITFSLSIDRKRWFHILATINKAANEHGMLAHGTCIFIKLLFSFFQENKDFIAFKEIEIIDLNIVPSETWHYVHSDIQKIALHAVLTFSKTRAKFFFFLTFTSVDIFKTVFIRVIHTHDSISFALRRVYHETVSLYSELFSAIMSNQCEIKSPDFCSLT